MYRMISEGVLADTNNKAIKIFDILYQKSLNCSNLASVTGGINSQPSSGYLSKLQVSPGCFT